MWRWLFRARLLQPRPSRFSPSLLTSCPITGQHWVVKPHLLLLLHPQEAVPQLRESQDPNHYRCTMFLRHLKARIYRWRCGKTWTGLYICHSVNIKMQIDNWNMKYVCSVCLYVNRDHHFNVVLHRSQDPEVQKHATEILRKMLEQEEAELQVWVQCSCHVCAVMPHLNPS